MNTPTFRIGFQDFTRVMYIYENSSEIERWESLIVQQAAVKSAELCVGTPCPRTRLLLSLHVISLYNVTVIDNLPDRSIEENELFIFYLRIFLNIALHLLDL